MKLATSSARALVVLLAAFCLQVSEGRSQNKPVEIPGWGKAVDPDSDCNFKVGGARLSIEVPGTPHALVIERNQMNAPRVIREVEGDFVAQVKVVGQFPRGAEALVEGRRPYHSAGFFLAKDDRSYIRFEKAEMVVGADNMTFAGFELRDGGVPRRMANGLESPLDPRHDHVFLRLEREGGKITAAVSADGVEWKPLAPMTVDWPAKLQIGVTAGHNTSHSFTAGFELLSVTKKQAAKK
jgi:regulation of enolase protein 1 (concanavalin A-like superfamily)